MRFNMKFSEDDLVLVGMNYNHYMIPKLRYPKNNLEQQKEQILKNQEMIKELKIMWDDNAYIKFIDKTAKVMRRYFGTRAE
jgi:hypothetical protein